MSDKDMYLGVEKEKEREALLGRFGVTLMQVTLIEQEVMICRLLSEKSDPC